MVQTKKYAIRGMSCGSCAMSIEMLLTNQPGVTSAHVDFDAKEAVIAFDDAAFKFSEVEKVIKQMGYSISET